MGTKAEIFYFLSDLYVGCSVDDANEEFFSWHSEQPGG